MRAEAKKPIKSRKTGAKLYASTVSRRPVAHPSSQRDNICEFKSRNPFIWISAFFLLKIDIHTFSSILSCIITAHHRIFKGLLHCWTLLFILYRLWKIYLKVREIRIICWIYRLFGGFYAILLQDKFCSIIFDVQVNKKHNMNDGELTY